MLGLQLERGIAVGDGRVVPAELDQRVGAAVEVVGVLRLELDRLPIGRNRVLMLAEFGERPAAVGLAERIVRLERDRFLEIGERAAEVA